MFLVPPVGEELASDMLVDISHESLIRKWKQLETWVEEECASRDQYLQIVRDALEYQKQPHEGRLWRDPKLKTALEWREPVKPNQAWANFYDDPDQPRLSLALGFLEKSKARQDAERAEREHDRLARERLRRFAIRRLAVGLVMTLLLLAFAIFELYRATDQRNDAERHRQIALARQLASQSDKMRLRHAYYWSKVFC